MLPLSDEPRITQAVGSGADLVIFSGDKLLGGPQAGIIVGRKHLIQKMRNHPLTRALRADKLCLAALEATLKSYVNGTATVELPTQRMLTEDVETVRERADLLAEKLRETSPEHLTFEVVKSVARSGGGTLPIHEIPSRAVRISGADAESLAKEFRNAEVPVVGRVSNEAFLLDARTLLPGDEGRIVAALQGYSGGSLDV